MNLSILEIVSVAAKKGIQLFLDNGELKLKTVKGKNIDSEFLALIKENKKEIIGFLENQLEGSGSSKETISNEIPEQRPAVIPLSYSQERLWYIDQLQGSLEYHMPVVFKLEGALDTQILEKSLRTIIERHEVLRTVIEASEDGLGQQKITAASDWSLQMVESASLTTDMNADILLFTEQSFDLSKDYMLRAKLYEIGEESHVLALVLHHIASDGWSEAILIQEFSAIYNTLKLEQPINLSQLPLQYADFSIWERKHFRGERLEKQLKYWENKLKGAPTLNLPTDYIRPQEQSKKGACVSTILDSQMNSRIVDLSKQEGVTPFVCLLAVFKILLAKYSGQHDICVGTPIANRTYAELENLIGFFVNTMVLRSDLIDNPTFKEVVSKVKRASLESYDHQQAPLEKVIERVVKKRDLRYNPLFQVMFVMQNTPNESDRIELEEVTLTRDKEALGITTAKFDLTLSIEATVSGLEVTLDYRTDLYSEQTAKQFLSHYKTLLQQVLDAPNKHIQDFVILTTAEQDFIVNNLSGKRLPYPEFSTVFDTFSEQVAKTPLAPAVKSSSTELNYGELELQSNQLAHYLIEQGVRSGSLVGICLERSAEVVISMLAILKVGASYVPIDYKYPIERISYILEDTGIKVIIGKEATLKALPLDIGSKKILLDTQNNSIGTAATESVKTEVPVDAMAYMMYTSGTTGKPKGVRITHKNIVSLATSCDYVPLNQDTRWLSTGSISFDATTIEFWGTLLNGGVLVLADTDTILETSSLKSVLDREKINTMWMTASWFHQVAIEDPSVFKTLSYLLVGGDKVGYIYTNKIKELYPALTIINGYGPTENTTFSTTHKIEGAQNKDLPIGTPIKNSTAYVLDETLKNIQPIGVIGELCVGGDGLSSGYWNRETLTQQRFISNSITGQGMIYRTGDLARWTIEGNLEFMGRKDNQVKIRGYRIELGEIENVLLQLDEVANCSVQVYENKEATKQLIAYIILKEPSVELDKLILSEKLRGFLPEYMVPQFWVSLKELPLTHNGKVDKKGLPLPELSELTAQEYVAPRNILEEQLAMIWQQLLGVPKIGIYDDFFELGGHSILAMRLISLIRKELSIEVPIKAVFRHPTIGELAKQLLTCDRETLPSITVKERGDKIPLSFSQERLWFIDQLHGSKAYHISIALRLKGDVDQVLLETSLRTIVERHEILRTIVFQEDGLGYQRTIPVDSWKMNTCEVADNIRLEDQLSDYTDAPFDLAKDYMLKACLYKQGNDESVLAVVVHHIAGDGWSMNILTEEFVAIYNSLKSGKEPLLEELPLQYADYAVWQRTHLTGKLLENRLNYWENRLQGAQKLDLSTDYPRPAFQGTAGNNLSIVLEEDLYGQLKAYCKLNGVTPFILLISAFKVMLSKYTGQEDICVGTSVANRTQAEIEGLIGFFVNNLVLRSTLNKKQRFTDFLHLVKENTLMDMDHQSVPFEKVVNKVVKTRDMRINPLFQVLFSFHENASKENELAQLNELELSVVEEFEVTAQFDIKMDVVEENSNFSIDINYRTDLFKVDTIERMLAHYKQLLTQIIEKPTAHIMDLSMLLPSEKKQLLTEFNKNGVSSSKGETIVSLFEEQVLKTPDHIALIFGETTLTYRELNEKSNCLAHCLVDNFGVGPNDFVGVMLEKSEWSIVSVLGILKAEAAYIPIDIDYPETRKSFIIKDAALKALIITSESLFEVINFEVPSFSIDIELPVLLSEKESIQNLSGTVTPSHLAYVIYTSGSTGNPKGVLVDHLALVDYIKESSTTYLLKGNGSYMHLSTSFDASITEIFTPLVNGKYLVISREKGLKVFEDSNLIKYAPYDFIKLTPAHLELVKPVLTLHSPEVLAYNYVLGGEALFPYHLAYFKELNIEAKIHNEYGPTEATVGCSLFSFETTNIPFQQNGFSIGKPMANTQIHVLKENLQLSPVGVVGELCVCGTGIAKGYLNQAALTKQKFIENPFGTTNNSRLYRTGDLAKWMPDGSLAFVGRKDEQVKIRGYRIELGEIETVLLQNNLVKNCCVLAKENQNGDKYLVGYVVSKETFEQQKIESFLKDKLPEYMIPLVWVPMEEIPLTTNGKIDRKALMNLENSDMVMAEYVAPENDIEQKLVVLWEELLGAERIGTRDNFFSLGGHSLLATRLVSMIRKAMEIDVEVASIFSAPTISELALYLSEQSKGLRLPDVVAQQKRERIPLSFSQERLWFIDQLNGSVEYHIPMVLRLQGVLDLKALEASLATILNRHQVLRTVITSEEGIGYQKVLPLGTWKIDVVSISDATNLKREVERFIAIPFDLSKDFMFRAKLFKKGEHEYVLAGVFHHIASDGWSDVILVNELKTLYNAFTSGTNSSLPELSVQYSDYAIWQKEHLEGPYLDGQLSYWVNHLQGAPKLNLPTDKKRPPVKSNEGAYLVLKLDKQKSDGLQELSKREGATLFMTLLTAFKVLLSRYSGQTDISVGTPIANRTQETLEGLIGFFANTIVLRSKLSGDPSFNTLLKQVKETTLGAYDHQMVPFEKVVDAVAAERDMSSTPLFQVMFILQNIDSEEVLEKVELDHLVLTSYEEDKPQTSKFDLSLNISESNTGISLGVEYSSALFNETTIQQLLEHYSTLLDSIVADSSVPISKLKMLTPHERMELLTAFNDTAIEYPSEKTMVNLFEEQARRTPENVAVRLGSQTLTYKELDTKSNQYARYLGKYVGKEARVGICMNRSLEMIVAVLGVLKSGSAYLPIDPTYPESRKSFMISDAGIHLMIGTTDTLAPKSGITGLTEILIDRDIEKILKESTRKLANKIQPGSSAYIIYTSGSTGMPKGVEVSHKGNVNMVLDQIRTFKITKEDRVLQFASLSFDASVYEMFIALYSGAQMVMVTDDTINDHELFVNYLKEKEVSMVTLPPAYLRVLPIEELSFLRVIVTAGEAADVEIALQCTEFSEYYNAYGPTECSVCVSVHKVGPFDRERKQIPIGGPISNTQLYVLGAGNELLPKGALGELCIGGVGLAKGYLNRPELTEERFIKNPFDELGNERLYKTGDLAKWLPNGNIEFVGRKDDQVKIRGYRIELGEVENVLSKLETIEKSIVLARTDGNGEKHLVGYIMLSDENVVFSKQEIQSRLRDYLPGYMIPQRWVSLKEFPLTSNGKIDKKALPDPKDMGLASNEYISPSNRTQEKLALIWQNLLGVEKVGINDNFFELGGHSLLATRFVSLVRKELEIELAITDIFNYTTIAELDAHLATKCKGLLLPEITVQEREEYVPLSFSQERLWFIDQLHGSEEYHIPVVLRLKGDLDVQILELSLKTIVDRHEVLRTVIKSAKGVGHQTTMAAGHWDLQIKGINDVAILEGLIKTFVMEPFDLEKDFMFRATLFELGEKDYVLAGVFHHIASDGWSNDILVKEFTALYRLLKEDAQKQLPKLPIQYADYAIWQRKYIEGDLLENQLSYWKEKLKGIENLSLPTDYVRRSEYNSSGAIFSFDLDKEVSDRLFELCLSEGVTLFMLLLSAFKILVSKYSNQKDISVGTPIANRTQEKLEGVIGYFVNTLVLRSDLGGAPTFAEFLQQIKTTTLEAQENQSAPFEKVVEKVLTSRAKGISPLFQVMFGLQNTAADGVQEQELEMEGVELTFYEEEHTSSKFDITLNAKENGIGISFDFEYRTDLFKEETIQQMAKHLEMLLRAIVENPNKEIGRLELLTPSEENQLLRVFNDTTVPYPDSKTIVDLFEEQVAKAPGDRALIFRGTSLTYQEINEKSNCLAHHLRDHFKVGIGDLVGIMLNRSEWCIVSILGILKAGAAFVPMDIHHPDARKTFVIEDTNLKLLIITSESLMEVIDFDIQLFSIDIEFNTLLEKESYRQNLSLDIGPKDPAYVIYTSGSTGKPKGVVVTHGSNVNMALDQIRTIGITREDRKLQFASLSFDASVYEIFIAFYSGACLVMIPNETIANHNDFLSYIREKEVSVVTLPPAYLKVLPTEELSFLRVIITAGEAANVQQAVQCSEFVDYYNAYGPTECAVCVSIYKVVKSDITRNRIPMGGPISNTELLILGANNELLPIGVIGELCVGGVGLAQGYLNRPDLTKEQFIDHPFKKGARLYKTGDTARWLPEGTIEYIGRKDNQVKIRGYRIELGEIENVLLGLSEVDQCVVLAKKDKKDNTRLVGYVIPNENLSFDKTAIQNSLKQLLPNYMIPQIWVSLEEIPLTANGKINKKALLSLSETSFSQYEYIAPRNEVEEKLADIWKELLGIEKVGMLDNFFELGGHSLLATRFVSMVRSELEIELAIADIFEFGTIEEISLYMQHLGTDKEKNKEYKVIMKI